MVCNSLCNLDSSSLTIDFPFCSNQRADCLEWEIIVMNRGEKPFDITMGLHNYFDISSLKNVVISGPFSGASTLDRNANAEGTASRYSNCVHFAIPFPGFLLRVILGDSAVLCTQFLAIAFCNKCHDMQFNVPLSNCTRAACIISLLTSSNVFYFLSISAMTSL